MQHAVRGWRVGVVLLIGVVLTAIGFGRTWETGRPSAQRPAAPTARADDNPPATTVSPSPSPRRALGSATARPPEPTTKASPNASHRPAGPQCDRTRSALDVSVTAGGDIQGAIDKVAAAGGGCVNLAEGSWTLGRSIRMKSGVTLNGSGASTHLQGPTSVYDYPLVTGDGTTQSVDMTAKSLANMTVENLVLDGRIPLSARTTDPNATANNPYADAMGILFASSNGSFRNILIKNVEVRRTSMGIHVKGTTGVTLDSVNVHHNGIAFWLHNVYLRRCQNVMIVHSRMNDSLVGTGLHVAGDSRNITIADSDFSGNDSSGMNIQDLPTHVTIRNSRMIGNNGDGVSAVGTALVITGNKARNNASNGIHTWTGSGRVDRNTATGNKSGDLNIHGHFAVADNAS
ncbi:right-handed parallel beta-helix repeat-containing protein [Streptomyces sp. NPDC051572]|uniref:right-handed parallel beta-helix repeat-containing protein n=2 Tax=Streptomyces TaxID=1883 RepID=UPI00345089AE